jgi:hypothetical protein
MRCPVWSSAGTLLVLSTERHRAMQGVWNDTAVGRRQVSRVKRALEGASKAAGRKGGKATARSR